MVERLFLAVPRGCLQFVIVVFPDHTHLLLLLSFRTSNHRLQIEVDRWRGIAVHERLCTYCNDGIGDEFHFY